MGDSGSLILGYILAVVAMMCSWKTSRINTGLLVPVLILGYPIFDTTLVSVMRVLEGRSLFQGGKDHTSHRIALLGFKRYRTVLVVYLCCIALGLAAIYVANSSWITGIAVSLAAFLSMLALGVRLSFVETRRYGRKKSAHGTQE